MAKPQAGQVQRRITYRLYPTPAQEAVLLTWLRLHAELYNAALQERRDAYRMAGKSITYYDQQNQLPAIKIDRPDLVPLGSHALQETVRRVDRAMAAFYRRVRVGEEPGYPRFKSWRRFSGWTWPDRAGWHFKPGPDGAHGRLIIAKLGAVKMRGQARTLGDPVSCTIRYKRGAWYASIVVNCTPRRRAGSGEIGMDLGVEKLAAFSNGKRIENPRHLAAEAEAIAEAQRALRAKRNKRSKRYRLAVQAVARRHAKVAARRQDFLHQESAKVIATYGLIATEELQVKNMTRSAKGTAAAPGKNVAQKAGLNRSILDVGMSDFLAKLKYKAEDAGTWFVEVPTRKVKPSQTCPCCWHRAKKRLDERVHHCLVCGYTADRDVAAALVMLIWATTGPPAGNQPGVARRETPSRSRQAIAGG